MKKRNIMLRAAIILAAIISLTLTFIMFQSFLEKPYGISKIEVVYYGYWDDPFVIRDSGTISKIVHYIMMARGQKEVEPEIQYGVARYVFTIHYADGNTFAFVLIGREKYSISTEVSEEGQDIVYLDDMSEMYDYVTQILRKRSA